MTSEKLISSEAILSSINCMMLAITGLGVGVFLVQHCYLVSYGLTTYEESKQIWTPCSPEQKSSSPFSANRGGFVANCVNTLCGPRYPRRLQLEKQQNSSQSVWIDVSNRPSSQFNRSPKLTEDKYANPKLTHNAVHPLPGV